MLLLQTTYTHPVLKRDGVSHDYKHALALAPHWNGMDRMLLLLRELRLLELQIPRWEGCALVLGWAANAAPILSSRFHLNKAQAVRFYTWEVNFFLKDWATVTCTQVLAGKPGHCYSFLQTARLQGNGQFIILFFKSDFEAVE